MKSLAFLFALGFVVASNQSWAQRFDNLLPPQPTVPVPSSASSIRLVPVITPVDNDSTIRPPTPVEAITNEIKKTTKNLEEMSDKLGRTQTDVKTRLNRIGERVDQVNKKTDVLNERLTKNESRVNTLVAAANKGDTSESRSENSQSTSRSSSSKVSRDHHRTRNHVAHKPKAQVIISTPDMSDAPPVASMPTVISR